MRVINKIQCFNLVAGVQKQTYSSPHFLRTGSFLLLPRRTQVVLTALLTVHTFRAGTVSSGHDKNRSDHSIMCNWGGQVGGGGGGGCGPKTTLDLRQLELDMEDCQGQGHGGLHG